MKLLKFESQTIISQTLDCKQEMNQNTWGFFIIIPINYDFSNFHIIINLHSNKCRGVCIDLYCQVDIL
jgi:hypothetical protein